MAAISRLGLWLTTIALSVPQTSHIWGAASPYQKMDFQTVSYRESGPSGPCLDRSQTFEIPDTMVSDNDRRRLLTRAQIRLNDDVNIEVSERRAPNEVKSYDSIIGVESRSGRRVHHVASLVRQGESLRLFRSATICTGAEQGLLVLEFVAGNTDSVQGFVLVEFSSESVNVVGIPLVRQGKIVVSRAHPKNIELWSASSKDDDLCGACAKRYTVDDCQLGSGMSNCRRRPGFVGSFEPNAVTSNPIEIRK